MNLYTKLSQHLVHSSCQSVAGNEVLESVTYKWDHTADEFCYTVQTMSSHDFFVGQFSTEREVPES